jgi:hypothetical protein
MAFPITCIDNFYQNPDEIVKFANSLEFKKTPGIYPGLRTELLSTLNPEFFNNFCTKLFSLFYDYNQGAVDWQVQTVFQKIYPFFDRNDSILNSGWIHLDSPNHIAAGVVYLNKDTDVKAGTSVYKIKYPEYLTDGPYDYLNYGDNTPRIDFYQNKKVNIEDYKNKKLQHEELFEKTLEFGNVYNRLVLYDVNYWHKESNFTVNTFEPRMTQVFFIESIMAHSFPILRKNNNIL